MDGSIGLNDGSQIVATHFALRGWRTTMKKIIEKISINTAAIIATAEIKGYSPAVTVLGTLVRVHCPQCEAIVQASFVGEGEKPAWVNTNCAFVLYNQTGRTIHACTCGYRHAVVKPQRPGIKPAFKPVVQTPTPVVEPNQEVDQGPPECDMATASQVEIAKEVPAKPPKKSKKAKKEVDRQS